MTKRVWVVSELFYPEESATGYFITNIAEGLAHYYPVQVISGQPGYSSGGVHAPAREEHNGVLIQRCASTTLNKDVLTSRLINLVTISASVFWKAIWQFRRYDDVIVVTNPPSLPFVVALACRVHGARCLLLIHDVYPEALVAAQLVRPEAMVTRFLNWMNRQLYRSVERIVVLGRDMQDLVARKLARSDGRIVIIPNWADIDQIFPQPRTESTFLEDLRLSKKFVVQYSGNMGRTHGLESLVETAERLGAEEDIHFLFIGSGAKKGWLAQAVIDRCLSNITILPTQPREHLCKSLNACDLAIISFVPGMAGVSVPSRMYNILAAGKPIIAVADSNSELALVVQEERVGWVVPADRPDRIAETILKARQVPEKLAEMGERARSAAVHKYAMPSVIASYRALLDNLNGGEPDKRRHATY